MSKLAAGDMFKIAEGLSLGELNQVMFKLRGIQREKERAYYTRANALRKLINEHDFPRALALDIIRDAEEYGETAFTSRKQKFPCEDMLTVWDDEYKFGYTQ